MDDWDSDIAALDAALGDATAARRALADAQAEMDLQEARALLGATGGNADTRKAAVALQLAASVAYLDLVSEARAARERLAEAERRAQVLKERCRLHRAAVAVAAGTCES